MDTPVNADFTTLVDDRLRFWNWTEIRLRVKNTTCPDPATADQCPLAVPPASIAFCLNDTTRFAGGAPEQFRRNDLYDCSNDGVSFRQGIGAAGADVHHKSAIGQMFVTDGLHGDFWLEAEVNPQPPGGTRAVIESDYSNNISRIVVTLP